MSTIHQRVIDIHTHIFPDVIAQKAADSIGSFYDLQMSHNGSLSGLMSCMEEAGISKACVHSVAITPKSIDSINRFILESVRIFPEKLTGFAAIHPDAENIASIVDNAICSHFSGFKIHPDMQHFALDSEPAMEMFAAMEGRMPVIIHTGDPRYSYSNPNQMKKVLDTFPKLVCVCAHLGGWGQWDHAWSLLSEYENVFVDTSSSLYALDPESATRIIRRFQPDHVLFGTDYPMWDPKDELERFRKLPLTDDEKNRILYGNAAQLLNLKDLSPI